MKQQYLIAVVVFGCILLSYPVLWLFNALVLLGGVPIVYLYLFAVWVALIGLIGTIVTTSGE